MRRSHLPFRPLAAGLIVVCASSSAFASFAYVVGVDANFAPHVQAFNGAGQLTHSFLAYDPAFLGGVRVAAGDIDGDGVPDIITGAGPGGGPHVKVFSGQTGAQIRSFLAFSPSFTGGVQVATGDINGDAIPDIVVGAGAGGGPQVSVFSGADGSLLNSFFAFSPSFTGGVTVATGDVNGDGHADIIASAGAGAASQITVFSGQTGSLLSSFLAFDPAFTGGVNVAAGDINGDGLAEIIASAGPGSAGGHIRAFNGQTGDAIGSFIPFDPAFTGGVRVAVGDLNGDGLVDIGAVPASDGLGVVRIFNLGTAGFEERFTFGPPFFGGTFIGAVVPAPAGLGLLALFAISTARRNRR